MIFCWSCILPPVLMFQAVLAFICLTIMLFYDVHVHVDFEVYVWERFSLFACVVQTKQFLNFFTQITVLCLRTFDNSISSRLFCQGIIDMNRNGNFCTGT